MNRPGISAEMLAEAGVRDVSGDEARHLVGFSAPGLAIPYRTLDGAALEIDNKPFYRLRLSNPSKGAKYLSPPGSGCQLYFPPRLRVLLTPGCTLAVIEGEFKALAAVEAGIPCVGIGGINSACPRNKLGESEILPDLATLIEEVRPSRIAFVGDADTALIPAFPREAVKLAKLAGIPVVLPRIALDAPGKGLDDLRAALGVEFSAYWQTILNAAEPVGAETNDAGLAVRLLRREADAFGRLSIEKQEAARSRLVKLGAGFRDDPLKFNEIVSFAADFAQIGKQVFRAAVKAEFLRQSREQGDAANPVIDTLYFDGRDYWRKEKDDNFGRLCREDVRLDLGMHGFSLRAFSAGEPSPADAALHRLQRERRVNYAGPLCGRLPGVHQVNDLQILVTRGPTFIEPRAGQCPMISGLIANLFGRATGHKLAPKQAQIFIGWLKLGRVAVRNSDQHRPGQVLALVGPPDCGKSLVQSAIITPALGGRAADPTLWVTGETTFNSDLFSAEHLLIGDKGLGEDGRERTRLRDELKRMVAARDYPLHAKHREALTLRPVWRISLSANDDPESAGNLPALDGSFADKIIYLQCFLPPKPFFEEEEPGARARFIETIANELPAFLAEVDAFVIPSDLRKERFGIREFHHPAILRLVERNSPLMPLAEALESWIEAWDTSTLQKELSSVQLYGELDEHLGKRLRLISSGPRRLGHQLGGLAALKGWRRRIIRGQRRTGGRIKNQRQTIWTIRRVVEQ